MKKGWIAEVNISIIMRVKILIIRYAILIAIQLVYYE